MEDHVDHRFWLERENLYEQILGDAIDGNLAVILIKTNGEDENLTQIVEFLGDDKYLLTTMDGYESEPLSREEVIEILRDLELDHYSIVEYTNYYNRLNWNDFEAKYVTPNLPRLKRVPVSAGEAVMLLPTQYIKLR